MPLPIIREAIVKFIDGSIVDYTYNREQQALERSIYDSVNRVRSEKFDTTGLDVLSLIIKQKHLNEILKGEKDIEYRDIKSKTNEAKMTFIDKETGKRYIRRPDILRLWTGYRKDRDVIMSGFMTWCISLLAILSIILERLWSMILRKVHDNYK